MNFNQLKYFMVLARVGSYSEAAYQLNIAQSTLSQAIIKLEEEFETPLFYSEKRVSYLTGAGSVLEKEAQKIIGSVIKSKEMIAQYLNGNVGNVTIGVSGSFGVTIVPQVIKTYQRFHPENLVTVKVVQGSTNRLVQSIRNHDIDLGICSYSPRDVDVQFSLIKREPYVVMTSNNHELANQNTVSEQDVLKYPIITFSAQSGAYYDVANILGVDINQLDVAMYVDDSAMMAAMVEAGIGIAVIPRIYLLENFNIAILPFETVRYRDVYCAWLKYQLLSPVAKEFRSLIQQSANITL